MANVKISALPAVTTVVPGSDVLPLVSGGITTKATPNAVVQAVLPSPGAIGGTTPAAITGTTITANTGFSGSLNGSVGASIPNTGAFTTLSASGTVSGTGFSDYLASPPAIGGTTAAAGTFTNLAYTGTLTGSTGVLNIGSGQIYKDASGNVGIGTSSPGAKLDVIGGVNSTLTSTVAKTNTASLVVGDQTAAGAKLDVQTASGTAASLRLYQQSVSNFTLSIPASTDGLAFSSYLGEKMRLTSAGYLGIGTSSPSAILSLAIPAATSTNTQVITATDNSYCDFNVYLDRQSTLANSVCRIITASGNMAFATSNTEKMRLDASGNLGLGVTPVAGYGTSFQLIGGVGWIYQSVNTNDKRLYITNNALPPAGGYTGGFNYSLTSVSATAYEQAAGFHAWYTAPSGTAGSAIPFTQAMTLDASGNLGIGTTSPNKSGHKALTINGTLAILELCSSDSLNGYLYGNASNITLNAQSTRPIIFETNGSERARIDSSGNTYLESGNFWQYAPEPTAVSTTTTLTAAQVAADIIVASGTLYTVTLPTGTALDTYFSGVPTTNIGFDFHLVNTASGVITIAVGASGMTSVGTLTVAAAAAAHFRLRRTAANTYILYRLS